MGIDNIVTALDEEIKHLQQVRSLLSSPGGTSPHSGTATKPATKKRKWKMSAEARKKIADAQRKRWAKQKAQK